MNQQSLLIQDVDHFGPLPPKLRETLWERLYRFFFGDDVFISYSRADAIRYVPSLAAQLAAKGHICFFDQLAADPSKGLPERLKKKILRSTVFVLVGTKGAVGSSFVRDEVELFRRTRRPFIPVDVDGALADQEGWRDVIGLAKIHEHGERVRAGEPSPEVVNLIKDSFRYTRRSQWLRASLLAGLSVILITAAFSFVVIRAAQARADTIKQVAEAQVVAANQEVSQAKKDAQNFRAEADRAKSDAVDARKETDRAATATRAAVAQQQAAELAARQAQALERQAAERAAESSRREAGSHAALLSREPGMEQAALALVVSAAEQSVATRGDFSDELMNGLAAAANVTDYSLPLEDPGAHEVMLPGISPNGERILGAIHQNRPPLTTLILWDGRTGKKSGEISIPSSGLTASFSRDGNRLVTVAYTQGLNVKLTVWDLTRSQPIPLETPCSAGPYLLDTLAALDSKGNRLVISQSRENKARQITTCEIDGGRLEEIAANFEEVDSVAFSPMDEPVVYGRSRVVDSPTTLYFLRSGRKIVTLDPNDSSGITFGGFGDDGSIIIISRKFTEEAVDDCVYVQSLDGDVRRLAGYHGAVSSAALVNGQVHVVTISARAIRLADRRSSTNFAALRAHARALSVLAFSPDDSTILTIDDGGKGLLWDVQTQQVRQELTIGDAASSPGQPPHFGPNVAAFRDDGTRLVTGNEKGEIQIWEVKSGHPVCFIPGGNENTQRQVFALSFLEDRMHVAVAYRNGTGDSFFINFLDAQTCQPSGTFRFSEPLDALSFSRDGKTMITAKSTTASTWMPQLKLWSFQGVDFRSDTALRLSSSMVGTPPGPLRDLVYDGRPMSFVTSDASGPLAVLRGSSTIHLQGPRPEIPLDFRMALSPDGSRLAAVWSGEARVWDTTSGQLLIAFKCDVDVIRSSPIMLSSDGSKVVIVGKDHVVRIYPTSRAAFLRVAQHLLGR